MYEHVNIWCKINVATVAVDAWRGLANTVLARLLVADSDIGWSSNGLNVRSIGRIVLALEQVSIGYRSLVR